MEKYIKVLNWVGGIFAFLALITSLSCRDYSESIAWGCVLLFYIKDMITGKWI